MFQLHPAPHCQNDHIRGPFYPDEEVVCKVRGAKKVVVVVVCQVELFLENDGLRFERLRAHALGETHSAKCQLHVYVFSLSSFFGARVGRNTIGIVT